MITDPLQFYTFAHYLTDGGIVTAAIAAILSDKCNIFIGSVIDNVIVPILHCDIDGDGVADIKNLEKKDLEIYGVKIKIGKVIIDFVKFVIVTYLIFIIAKILNLNKTNHNHNHN